jgi:hypothetical protein
MELLDGRAASGRPEVIVVVDYETLRTGVSPESTIRVSGDVELPVATVRRLACDANMIPAVLGSDGEVLDLGRSARLASAAQRRALRAMFATCWIPGCDVPFDNCTMHHVQWWEQMGPSDLTNFRPTFTTHHHELHEGGWLVEIDGWWATITRPDGVVMRTGPPSARAA